nr:uncharacterized protein LOC123762280 [Procambarus clarkii]
MVDINDDSRTITHDDWMKLSFNSVVFQRFHGYNTIETLGWFHGHSLFYKVACTEELLYAFEYEKCALDVLQNTGVTPRVLGFCTAPPVLIMTAVGDLSLLEYLEVCATWEVMPALQATAEALDKIHNTGIVHGNFTFDNVMIDIVQNVYYIVDFSASSFEGWERPENPDEPHFAEETLCENYIAHSSQDVFSFGKHVQTLCQVRDLPQEVEQASLCLMDDDPQYRPSMAQMAEKLFEIQNIYFESSFEKTIPMYNDKAFITEMSRGDELLRSQQG